MKFSIGNKVRMSKAGKEIYSNKWSNPHNLTGRIISLRLGSSYSYRVQWENFSENVYQNDEIEHVFDLSTVSLEDYL